MQRVQHGILHHPRAVGMTREQAARYGIVVIEEARAMGTEAWVQIAGELDGFIKLVISRSCRNFSLF